MVEKEVFVANIRNLLSADQGKEDILNYIQGLGISEKKAFELMAEAEKGLSVRGKGSIGMGPATMEEQVAKLKEQKIEIRKAMFRKNIEALNEMMAKMREDIKDKEADK